MGISTLFRFVGSAGGAWRYVAKSGAGFVRPPAVVDPAGPWRASPKRCPRGARAMKAITKIDKILGLVPRALPEPGSMAVELSV